MQIHYKDFFEKYFKNFKNSNNKIYASPLKRLGSFIIDTLIILVLFNVSIKVLEYFNTDFTIDKIEIITKDDGTENERLDIKKMINQKNFSKLYYLMMGISALYFTILLSSKKQATIGNQIFKIAVVNIKRARVSPLDAFLRYISLILNNTVYGFGYLTYFFTEDRSFFQDIVSNTRVINLTKKNKIN